LAQVWLKLLCRIAASVVWSMDSDNGQWLPKRRRLVNESLLALAVPLHRAQAGGADSGPHRRKFKRGVLPSFPTGARVRLRSQPSRVGRVLAVCGSWRQVVFDRGGNASHRPSKLESISEDFPLVGPMDARPRRRLWGKQPPAVASGPIPPRRRLTGKQSPALALAVHRRHARDVASAPVRPNATTVKLSAPFYAALRVAPAVSAQELRGAYRRRALQTHPDKGGECSEFNAVQAAYETLGDPIKRIAYDRQWGLASVVQVSVDANIAQKRSMAPEAILATLLELLPAEWPSRLQELSRQELQDLAQCLSIGAEAAAPTCNYGRLGSRVVGTKGIYTTKELSYYCKLQWNRISCTTPCTPSLEQAIDWHSNLVALRGEASRRLARGARFNEAAMALSSGQPLWYETYCCISGSRYCTPCMRDLRSVLTLRDSLELVAGAESVDEKKRRKATEQIRMKVSKRLEGFMKHAGIRRTMIFRLVQEELAGTSVLRMPLESQLSLPSRALGA